MSQPNQNQNQASQTELKERMSSSTNSKVKKMPESVAQFIKQQTSKGKQTLPSQLNNRSINTHNRQFVCRICHMGHPQANKNSIGSCGHQFCANCLGKYISYKIESFQSVQCPDEECEKVLDEKSSLYSSLTEIQKQKYKKYLRYELTLKNQNIRLCPSEKCDGFLENKQSNSPIKNLACCSCKNIFCTQCLLPEHKGECDSYSLEYFQNTLRFRQCPNCKNMIEKSVGCDHITCRCQYHFCYNCGKKWEVGHICQLSHLPFRPYRPHQPQPQRYQPCCCACCDNCCDGCLASICLACDDTLLCRFCTCFDGGFWTGSGKFLYFILWVTMVLPATYIQLGIMICLKVLLGILYGVFGFWHIGPTFVRDTGISQWSTPAQVAAGVLFPVSWLWLIGYTIKSRFENVDEILTIRYILYLPFRLFHRCMCE